MLDLSAKEFALLRVLAGDPTRVFTKAELLRDSGDTGPSARRGRSTPTPAGCAKARGRRRRYVVNVWGVGYRLVDAPAVDAPNLSLVA